MLAVDVVRQMKTIEERASIALQAYGSGEDSQELITTFLACVAGIFVEIHECDTSELEKIQALAELIEEVESDRMRSINVYFHASLP